MTARTHIQAALTAKLPQWAISKDPALPDQIARTTLVIEPGTVTRVDGGRSADYALDAHLIVPTGPREQREDRLEAALDDLLEAIEATAALTWTTARRTTLADTYHAYTVGLQIRMGKEPARAISPRK